MKKLISLFIAVILAFSLTSCVTINVTAPESGGKEPPQTEDAEIQKEDTGQQEVSSQQSQSSQQMETSTQQTEASDASSEEEISQQSAEELQDLYSQWAQVVGYWNAADGIFALVDMMDSHTLCFLSGVWEAGGRDLGMVTDIRSYSEYELTAVVEYSYYDDDEHITSVENVVIDYSGLDRDGKIQIGVNGEWHQYMFAGNTMDEAYQTYYDNTYGG